MTNKTFTYVVMTGSDANLRFTEIMGSKPPCQDTHGWILFVDENQIEIARFSRSSMRGCWRTDSAQKLNDKPVVKHGDEDIDPDLRDALREDYESDRADYERDRLADIRLAVEEARRPWFESPPAYVFDLIRALRTGTSLDFVGHEVPDIVQREIEQAVGTTAGLKGCHAQMLQNELDAAVDRARAAEAKFERHLRSGYFEDVKPGDLDVPSTAGKTVVTRSKPSFGEMHPGKTLSELAEPTGRGDIEP